MAASASRQIDLVPDARCNAEVPTRQVGKEVDSLFCNPTKIDTEWIIYAPIGICPTFNFCLGFVYNM